MTIKPCCGAIFYCDCFLFYDYSKSKKQPSCFTLALCWFIFISLLQNTNANEVCANVRTEDFENSSELANLRKANNELFHFAVSKLLHNDQYDK